MRCKKNQFTIPWAQPFLLNKSKPYMLDALKSTWISGGAYVEKLQYEFARFHHKKYGVAVSSGTASLYMALLSLNIGTGDEVIIPGFCFAGVANMVMASGAKAVFADIKPDTWCISPESVKQCITRKTRAIIPVHTYGNVCDMDSLTKIAKKYKLHIIEDAAEAAFSKYKGRYCGTFGDIGCFSFHATKTITTGEGGFLLTDDRNIYDRLMLIRDHGMNKVKRYWHDIIGYNFRITNLQAALGCSQIENLNTIILNKKRVYGLYRKNLQDQPGFIMQHFDSNVEPVVWAVAVKLNKKYFNGKRDKIISLLFQSGIETRPGFYPYNLMPVYKNAKHLAVSEDVSLNVISLPSFPNIKQKEVLFVCEKLKKSQI